MLLLEWSAEQDILAQAPGLDPGLLLAQRYLLHHRRQDQGRFRENFQSCGESQSKIENKNKKDL